MASAVGIPTITIFGTGEPVRYRPWGEKSSWFVGEQQKVEKVSVDEVVKQLQKKNLTK